MLVELEKQSSPGKRHASWLSNTKWSTLKTGVQVTLYRLSGLYLGIYACSHTITMKKEQGKVYDRIWRRKCDYIIISNLLNICIKMIPTILIVKKNKNNFYSQK